MNLEAFLRKCDFTDASTLRLSLHPRWVSVHPVVLAITACAGSAVRQQGGAVTLDIPNPSIASVRYLSRMKLFEHLDVPEPRPVTEHEPAGRFVPVTCVRTKEDLHQFITDMIPLLHDSPSEVGPVKYVISELVRNVLEHAQAGGGAFVCAQYYKDSKKVGLGVADAGIGIRQSLSSFHPTATDVAGICMAMRPGITGTSSRFGGTEYNAGAGLFFTKNIAALSRCHMDLVSGTGFYKLLKASAGRPITINRDPLRDKHRAAGDIPHWHGTAVGIDIGVPPSVRFSDAFERISKAFNVHLQEKKRAKYKQPRFVR
jgi:anti-sigma regulatory factor (Ser/Thr protein kinase)